MTASELLALQIDDAGKQLLAALEGLPSEQRDARATPASMSANDMVAHLAECYQAAVTEIGGGSHQWGSFVLDGQTWEQRLAAWADLRAQAKAAATAGGDQALKEGHAYIVGHDYYHVGQMCLLRLHLDPEWDFMAIYR